MIALFVLLVFAFVARFPVRYRCVDCGRPCFSDIFLAYFLEGHKHNYAHARCSGFGGPADDS